MRRHLSKQEEEDKRRLDHRGVFEINTPASVKDDHILKEAILYSKSSASDHLEDSGPKEPADFGTKLEHDTSIQNDDGKEFTDILKVFTRNKDSFFTANEKNALKLTSDSANVDINNSEFRINEFSSNADKKFSIDYVIDQDSFALQNKRFPSLCATRTGNNLDTIDGADLKYDSKADLELNLKKHKLENKNHTLCDVPDEKNIQDSLCFRGTSSDVNLDLQKMTNDMEGFLETELIDWMLSSEEKVLETIYFDFSPASSHKDVQNMITLLYFSSSQSTMSEETRLKMIEMIPTLRYNTYFSLNHIENYLEHYWSIYHVQQPIIHRPTFVASQVHPLLLLSMIIIGAFHVSNKTLEQEWVTDSIRQMADQIAEPLRWLIFSAIDSAPSVNSWMLQSLLILECYEITCTNRRLHRRAHLHHGFKIELLRRSPFLGGDPLQNSIYDKKLASENTFWESWIEIESLKRCAYTAFFIDLFRAIIFGHDCIVYAHHIKLSLPCSDEFWEMSDVNFDKCKMQANMNNPKFLSVLAKLLRKERYEAGPFCRKILLAGLLSTMFQMEQRDMQTKVLQWDNIRSTWKSAILSTIDYWYDECCNSSCHALDTAYYIAPEILSAYVSYPEDKTCKFPMYHISQAFLRVKQYDCIIYAGAPNRMNVKADHKDYETVKRRVNEWKNTYDGKVAAVHAYLLISEILLCQDEEGKEILLSYDPNKDAIYYRPNVVASLLFLIWGFNYSLSGPESDYYSGHENNDDIQCMNVAFPIADKCLPEKVNGYVYIRFIKEAFHEAIKEKQIHKISEKIEHFTKAIDRISNKHHTVGLLRLFKDRYERSSSQICREYGRLMENCIQRSLGRKKIVCDGMYDERID